MAKLLWEEWDPIGVNHGIKYGSKDEDAWTDEYDQYAKKIVTMLLEGADSHKMMTHLDRLFDRGNSGADANKEFADRLIGLVS